MLSTRVRMSQQSFTFGPPAFTPTSIASLVLWTDANAIGGLNNNDPVTTWSDLSGQGNNFTQSTAGLKPLYKTNILNGKPVLYFDNSDDGMVGTLNLSAYPTFSVLAVYAVHDTLTGAHRALQGLENNWVFCLANAGFHTWYNTSSIDGPATSLDAFVSCIGVTTDGVGSTMRVNRTDYTPSNGTGTPNTICLGNSGLNAQPLGGYIAEVMAFNAALTAGQITSLESYILAKYGL